MTSPLKKRFTKDLIERMAQRLTNHSYAKKIQDADEAYVAVCNEVYVEYYGQEAIDKMNTLPDGWLNQSSSEYLYFQNNDGTKLSTVSLLMSKLLSRGDFSRASYKSTESYSYIALRFGKSLRQMEYVRINNIRLPFSNPIIEKLIAAHDSLVEVKAESYEFQEQMVGILDNLRSFHKLYEQWPEVREILKVFEPTASSSGGALLPAISFDSLNKQLGIPTSSAA